jgi:phosphoribosylamine--glycine ligase
VVVEDFLAGEEASFIVMVDGRNVLPLASSQDHKRLCDHDQGPNTGGMGAYSPAPVVTPEMHARIMREVILPTVSGMATDGIRYTGFLYAGVMIDAAGNPRVLEFNCRLGDPETQPIMVRLKSDLVELLEKAIDGRLDQAAAEWDRRAALGVVLAAQGYPEAPRYGDAIDGLERVNAAAHPDCMVFHAGTKVADGGVVVAGGRVLCVTALGDSVRQAQRAAYAAIAEIRFAGMQFRTDIGYRAVAPRKG